MQVSEILQSEQAPKVGELRLWRGNRSMCINPRVHYAGGIGPLWATERLLHEFLLVGFQHYFRGFCLQVDPKLKMVLFTITQGNTWGSLTQGMTVSISADSFMSCHIPNPESPSLFDLSQIKEAEIKAKQAFIDLSVNEIEAIFSKHYSNQMQTLVGHDVHQWLHAVFIEYNKLRIMAIDAGPWYIDHPNRAINRQIKKLINRVNNYSTFTNIIETKND